VSDPYIPIHAYHSALFQYISLDLLDNVVSDDLILHLLANSVVTDPGEINNVGSSAANPTVAISDNGCVPHQDKETSERFRKWRNQSMCKKAKRKALKQQISKISSINCKHL